MTIGINATAAIKQPRTGVEEYTYQLIKHLTMLPEAREHRFFLYIPEKKINLLTPLRSAQGISPERSVAESRANPFDFPLPSNFEIKVLRWPLPFLWTQARLAWEILWHSPEVLFIPVHVLPFGALKKSVVVLHGLEYEYFPEYYSFWRRWYLRYSTKSAARRASKIIAISTNTKNDLVKFYGIKSDKIEVVHHGIDKEKNPSTHPSTSSGLARGINSPYILYLGRIETKKNVQGILEAYKILKEKYGVPHKLFLAGAPGYGYHNLKLEIKNLLEIGYWKLEIKELGYVVEKEKQYLLSNADIFLFPSFYEGFGLPVLEAQAADVPVVTSFNSCLPEIAGQGAIFVDPKNSEQIAEAAKQAIDDGVLRDRLIQLGRENVKRFNWEKCARETLKIVASG